MKKFVTSFYLIALIIFKIIVYKKKIIGNFNHKDSFKQLRKPGKYLVTVYIFVSDKLQ